MKTINQNELYKLIKESIDDEMKLWDERDNSEFGKIIRKLDTIMKDMFVDTDEYGFKVSPISHYVTAYALDGNEQYTAKRIYATLENYDMLQEPNVKRLVNKMLKIAQGQSAPSLNKIVGESIKRVLKENSDNTDLIVKLNNTLSMFTHASINTNYGSENDWEEIIDSIVDLFNCAKAKEMFDKQNIGTQYRQALAQGKGDEYYESLNLDYYYLELDDYLDNIDKWDKYMPTPSEVDEMAYYFLDWLEAIFNEEIRDYGKIKMSELDNYRSKFNKNIY